MASATLEPATVRELTSVLAGALHQVYLALLSAAVAVLAWRLTASIPATPAGAPSAPRVPERGARAGH